MSEEWSEMTIEEKLALNAQFVIEKLSDVAGFQLGLNEDSVAWIDGFIERQRSREGFTPEKAEGLVNTIGSFLGECLRAELGGQWAQVEDGQVCVVFSNGNAAYPFNKVRKHFEHGDGDSILSFFQTAKVLFST